MTEQVERVTRMEEIYDACRETMDALLAATERYLQLQPQLEELTQYYQSPQWLADFDADRAGLLPRDLKRGILTEDSIWDLLTDGVRLQQLLQKPPFFEIQE